MNNIDGSNEAKGCYKTAEEARQALSDTTDHKAKIQFIKEGRVNE